MHMLRHDHEAVYASPIPCPCALQGLHEDVADGRIREVRKPVVTSKCDEMRCTRMVEAIESAGHGESLCLGLPQLPTEGNCGPPTVCPQFSRRECLKTSGWDCACTLVVHDNDVFRGDCA